jgi:uncharacterized protein (TIGR02145 family)
MKLKNIIKIIAILVLAVIFACCTSEEIAEESDFSSSSDASNIVSYSSSFGSSSSSGFSSNSSIVGSSSSRSLAGPASSSSSRPLSSSSLATPSSSSQPSSSSSNPSSSSRVAIVTGSFTDSRDEQSYVTVTIGSQTWMAENLNYNESGSACYDNQNSYCYIYGRLYNWVTAMNLPASCISTSCALQINVKHRGVCPAGWHIPSNDEWVVLVNYAGGNSAAGKHLKATSGWDNNGNGLDTYGFAALSGGDGWTGGDFNSIGSYGYWWSSSEYGRDGSDYAEYRSMYSYYESVDWYNYDKNYLFSVRCLKD